MKINIVISIFIAISKLSLRSLGPFSRNFSARCFVNMQLEWPQPTFYSPPSSFFSGAL